VWSKALKSKEAVEAPGGELVFVVIVSAVANAQSGFSESGTGRFQKRQEGNGAGDSVRLHGRRNALKGEPQERIRHETRPAGSKRIKASRGRENLKAHGRSGSGSLIT
jgi:hypothetical protein